jgi:hypothetical protein
VNHTTAPFTCYYMVSSLFDRFIKIGRIRAERRRLAEDPFPNPSSRRLQYCPVTAGWSQGPRASDPAVTSFSSAFRHLPPLSSLALHAQAVARIQLGINRSGPPPRPPSGDLVTPLPLSG